jgi:hypothetical protein
LGILSNGKVLCPGEKYEISEYPIFQKIRVECMMYLPLTRNDGKEPVSTHAERVVEVYIPTSAYTIEELKIIGPVLNDLRVLGSLLIVKSKREKWNLVEQNERRGPANVRVIGYGNVPYSISVLELLPKTSVQTK